MTSPHDRDPSLAEKLRSKAIQQGECLIWTGRKNTRGYGLIQRDGRKLLTHRVAYELQVGPIPVGAVLRHKCDNPSCIAIAHLEPGTQRDNVHDMLKRGRAKPSAGERHSSAKLTADQVREIRRRYVPGAYGKGPYVLAKEFGVSKQSIQSLLKGKTWRTVQ